MIPRTIAAVATAFTALAAATDAGPERHRYDYPLYQYEAGMECAVLGGGNRHVKTFYDYDRKAHQRKPPGPALLSLLTTVGCVIGGAAGLRVEEIGEDHVIYVSGSGRGYPMAVVRVPGQTYVVGKNVTGEPYFVVLGTLRHDKLGTIVRARELAAAEVDERKHAWGLRQDASRLAAEKPGSAATKAAATAVSDYVKRFERRRYERFLALFRKPDSVELNGDLAPSVVAAMKSHVDAQRSVASCQEGIFWEPLAILYVAQQWLAGPGRGDGAISPEAVAKQAARCLELAAAATE